MKHYKKFDKFGENFSFNYNGYNKYSTRMGGCFFLIFIIIALFFFIINFIHFCKKENYSIQYYSYHSKPEKIKPTRNFAFGVACENRNDLGGIFVNKFFSVSINYINNRISNLIKTEKCSPILSEMIFLIR